MSQPPVPHLSLLLAHCQQARRDASFIKDLSEVASRRLYATVRAADARIAAHAPEGPPAPVVSEPRRRDRLR